MGSFPEIAFGTYEEFILGYKPQVVVKKSGIEFVQSFASHSHQASIRCVAAHGNYLASSGADEYINIYDILLKKVLTVINFHNSTVTCLEFVPDGSHLISSNQAGDIAIFNCIDWSIVKYWKEAHKGGNGVNDISVHPSGALFISAGDDNILRFWNLIKGRLTYTINLSKKYSIGSSLNFAKWSKTGTYYIICIGKTAEIFLTDSATAIYKIECQFKISSLDSSTCDLLFIGLDNGILQIHNMKKRKKVYEEKCHQTRLKCLSTFKVPKNCGIKSINYLITADSRGKIKLWRFKFNKSVSSLTLKSETNADCRITCLTVIQPEIKEEMEDNYVENNCT